MSLTVAEVTRMLREADAAQLSVLERSLAADTRKGVRTALEQARRRIEAQAAEQARLDRLYDYQRELAEAHGGTVVVGLDEVGRGPLAGPLAVGAVVLPDQPHIPGLNDSKKLTAKQREAAAEAVREHALAWTVEYVEPDVIDERGIMASLVMAFSQAVKDIEGAGIAVDMVLLDGNPLHFDSREVNVVGGDGKCASIAAASIVAKVARDQLMCELDEKYPGYGLAENKGYGSAEHIAAIKEKGLSPIHRASYCTSFFQESLF